MRLLFYYPNINRPVGGMKQIRLQVQLLRECGIKASLLRDERDSRAPVQFDDNRFYSIDVPSSSEPFHVVAANGETDDIIIIPEYLVAKRLPELSKFRGIIGINNQNGFVSLRTGSGPKNSKVKISFAIANAPYVAALCGEVYGLETNRIFEVPHWIVRAPFTLSTQASCSTLAICYMPRKINQLTTRVMERILERRPDIAWIPIHNMNEHQVAETMRSHKIFFAAQCDEGCPMTALEAMTCGSIVAGFPGTRSYPHPYANRSNGFWAKDLSVPDAISAVENAIKLVEANGNAYREMIRSGHDTANRYSKDAMKDALRELTETLKFGDYSIRKVRPLLNDLRFKALTFWYRESRSGLLAELRWKYKGLMRKWLSQTSKR